MHAIENTNLEAHVSICQERYQALERRFEHVENKIDAISTTIEDIHQHVHALAQAQSDRWSAAQIGVIGVLMAIIGFLTSQIWA